MSFAIGVLQVAVYLILQDIIGPNAVLIPLVAMAAVMAVIGYCVGVSTEANRLTGAVALVLIPGYVANLIPGTENKEWRNEPSFAGVLLGTPTFFIMFVITRQLMHDSRAAAEIALALQFILVILIALFTIASKPRPTLAR